MTPIIIIKAKTKNEQVASNVSKLYPENKNEKQVTFLRVTKNF